MLKKVFSNKLVENWLSLFSLRILTLVLPLLTYPYMMKTLGTERYGLVIWVWSITNLFVFVTKFGFDTTITKRIAISKDNKGELNKIISNTYMAKFCLLIFVSIIFTSLALFIPKFEEHKVLFLCFLLLPLGDVLFPIWYFQGTEKMKYIGIIVSSVKISFTLLVFIIVDNTDDYVKVPLLYALSSIISGIIAIYIVFVKDGNKFCDIDFRFILSILQDSISIFLSNSVLTLKDSIMIILVERYAGLDVVAYLDIVQKFVNILITPFHILSSVIYPRMSVTRNLTMYYKVILYSNVFAVALCSIVLFSSEMIFSVLYINSEVSFEFFSVMVISVIFMNTSNLLGLNGLIVFGRDYKFLISSVVPVIFFFFFCSILIISNKFTLEYIAYVSMTSVLIELIIRFYFMFPVFESKK
jgi:PST family polysaccharide transporter